MLRLQTEGRRAQCDDELFAGSHGLFAATQAAEQVLGTDGPVFIQGIALDMLARWRGP